MTDSEPQEQQFSPDFFTQYVGEGEQNGLPATIYALSREQLSKEQKAKITNNIKEGLAAAVAAGTIILYSVSTKVKDIVDGVPTWIYRVLIIKYADKINWLYETAQVKVGHALKAFGQIMNEKVKEIGQWAYETASSCKDSIASFAMEHQSEIAHVGKLVSCAAVGILIGCTLGKIEEYQRSVISPYIAKATSKTARFLGLIEDDDISEAKFSVSLEKILKNVITLLLVVGAGVLGGIAGGMITGTIHGVAIGAAFALGTIAWKALQ